MLISLQNVPYQGQAKEDILIDFGTYRLPSRAWNMIITKQTHGGVMKKMLIGVQLMETPFVDMAVDGKITITINVKNSAAGVGVVNSPQRDGRAAR